MRRSIGRAVVTAIGVVIAALLILAGPVILDEAQWHRAVGQDTGVAYGDYVRDWPTGRHAAEARFRYDERDWQAASAIGTAEALEGYLHDHSDGAHVAEAEGWIEHLHWRMAAETDMVTGYEQYLRRYPAGRFAAGAKARIAALVWQEAPRIPDLGWGRRDKPDGMYVIEAEGWIEYLHWQTAVVIDTIAGYEQYLRRYPAGWFADKANDQIARLVEK